MANAYTPEEIAELKAREADEIKRFGKATVETRMALIDMAVGAKGATAAMTKGFNSLGTSALGLTKQLYDGEVGASVFNKSIGGVTDALGDLVGLIPYVGGALKTLVKGASEYTQAVNKQADLLYSNYQRMSEMGAAGAKGMQGVYDNLKRMNYGTEELDKFVSIVKENSQTLAHFGGTATQGLDQISSVAQAIQQSNLGTEFRNMGISVDEINKGIAGFTKMQSLYGTRQRMTSEEQAAAASNYIREIDLLAKITGKNREQQQALEESAMAEERFAGYRQELKKRAEMGDLAAAEQIKTVDATQKWLGDQAPETRKGFLNILSGTLDTPEAKKLLLTMPEAAAVASKKMFSVTEFQTAMLSDLKRNEDAANQMAQVGVNDSTFLKYTEQLRLRANLEGGLMDERLKQAKQEQKVNDQGTKDITKIQEENRKSRDNLQDLVNAGIPKVTAGMKGLATATDKTIDTMTKAAEKLGVSVKKRDESAPPAVAPRAAAPPPAAPAPAAPAPAAPAPVAATPAPAAPAPAAPAPAAPVAAAPVAAAPVAAAAAPPAAPKAAAAPVAAAAAPPAPVAAAAAPPAPAATPRAAAAPAAATPRAAAAPAAAAPQAAAPISIPSGGGTAAPAAPTTGKKVAENKEGKKEKVSMSGNAGKLADELEKYGITNALAKRAIIQTAAKESGLNPQAKESGATAYLATLANRGLDYIWKVFPQLKPGGRVAKEKGFEKTGVPASALNEAWSKGDQSFFDYVYGGLSTNKNPGDAYKYRGRGFIQLTGRSVYDKVGKEVGKDFVNDPDQVATDFNSSAAALAGYMFMTRGGKANALKDLNSMTDPNEALKYALHTVAGLGHKKSDFDVAGSNLQEQFKKASAYGSLANEAVPAQFQAKNGGIVPALPGGVNVLAGEAGQNEAVVPLPNGKSIPIETAKNTEQMDVMFAQLGRMDELIRIMQNQLGVSEKLLKYAQ